MEECKVVGHEANATPANVLRYCTVFVYTCFRLYHSTAEMRWHHPGIAAPWRD